MEKLLDDYHNLMFGVMRSSRYHIKRRQHFELVQKIFKFITLFAVFGIILSVTIENVGPSGCLFFSSIFIFCSLIDLSLNVSEKIRLHSVLTRRFITLENDLTKSINHLDENMLSSLKVNRLDIEAEEPPKKSILDIICHNELARARGYDEKEQVELYWWQRWFCHYLF